MLGRRDLDFGADCVRLVECRKVTATDVERKSCFKAEVSGLLNEVFATQSTSKQCEALATEDLNPWVALLQLSQLLLSISPLSPPRTSPQTPHQVPRLHPRKSLPLIIYPNAENNFIIQVPNMHIMRLVTTCRSP